MFSDMYANDKTLSPSALTSSKVSSLGKLRKLTEAYAVEKCIYCIDDSPQISMAGSEVKVSIGPND